MTANNGGLVKIGSNMAAAVLEDLRVINAHNRHRTQRMLRVQIVLI